MGRQAFFNDFKGFWLIDTPGQYVPPLQAIDSIGFFDWMCSPHRSAANVFFTLAGAAPQKAADHFACRLTNTDPVVFFSALTY